MCEPNHSIIQWPNDDSGNDRLGMVLGNLKQWCKTIGGYLNLSKFGKGHSEAIEKMVRTHLSLGERASFLLPDHYDYEVQWWSRNVNRDCCKPPMFAMESAVAYAHATSIGNLSQLRRFLETSMMQSDRPYGYTVVFADMLNANGRDVYHNMLRDAKLRPLQRSLQNNPHTLRRATAIMCKLTRKRNLLVPEWADDSVIWN